MQDSKSAIKLLLRLHNDCGSMSKLIVTETAAFGCPLNLQRSAGGLSDDTHTVAAA